MQSSAANLIVKVTCAVYASTPFHPALLQRVHTVSRHCHFDVFTPELNALFLQENNPMIFLCIDDRPSQVQNMRSLIRKWNLFPRCFSPSPSPPPHLILNAAISMTAYTRARYSGHLLSGGWVPSSCQLWF